MYLRSTKNSFKDAANRVTQFDFENLSKNKGCDLEEFVESLILAGNSHSVVLKAYKRKIS